MTILFDATRRVKSARPFAAGLLAFTPMTFVEHTAADEDAYAQMAADLEQGRRDFDEHLEERAAMAAGLNAVSSGTPWL